MMSKKLAIFAWFLFICTNGMAFFFSSQPAEVSSQTSSFLSQTVVEQINQTFELSLPASEQSLLEQSLELPLRKLAHFTEYAMMGGFAFLGCYAFHYQIRRRYFLIAWACIILSASLDELHQFFVYGRSSEIRDVCIDSLGGITGIFFMFSCISLFSFLKSSSQKETKKP